VKQQQQQVQQATQRFNQMRSAAAAPASNSNLYSRLQAIARRTGVTITRFSESGNRASITVQGPSHVQLGNFIDQVTRAGITNDPGPANLRPVMVNGRRLMETTYNIPLL
jgi:type II secretory pathway component PulM